MYSKELDAMKEAAIAAGQAIMEIYNSADFIIQTKIDNSPVTEADQKADEIITNYLRSSFPHYALLSEESFDTQARLESEFCFIIDPLDGTKEFIKRNGEFTVNIALCKNNVILAGVIFLPVLSELYFASKGNGSYLEKDGKLEKLKTSNRTENLRLAVSRSHRTDEEDRLMSVMNITEVVEAGSSLKGCLVAKGVADLYVRYGNTMEWDVAAMQIIVEEAGGIMMHTDGEKTIYNKPEPKNRSFYASNGIITVGGK